MNTNSGFSNLNKTWSRWSDLHMNDWDPYPELQGVNCYARESYCSGNSGPASIPCGPCAVYPNQIMAYSTTNPGGTAARTTVKISEGFCCNSNPMGYSGLASTWEPQKKYTL